MNDVIQITRPLVTVTGPDKQLLNLAVDVSRYDELCLMTFVTAFTGTTLNIALYTASQIDTDDGWTQVFTNTFTLAGQSINLVAKGNFLRFIRWQVPSATISTVDFSMAGVARCYSYSGRTAVAAGGSTASDSAYGATAYSAGAASTSPVPSSSVPTAATTKGGPSVAPWMQKGRPLRPGGKLYTPPHPPSGIRFPPKR
jgi:hypothetical protein